MFSNYNEQINTLDIILLSDNIYLADFSPFQRSGESQESSFTCHGRDAYYLSCLAL